MRMKDLRWRYLPSALGAGALLLAVPAAASAQTGQTEGPAVTGGDPDVRAARQVVVVEQQPLESDFEPSADTNEWVVSGYVGPNFGNDVNDANTAFGGAVSYLYDRKVGAEVLANFSPNFGFSPATLGESIVNSYMVNGVAALPLGDRGKVQPFVSGGVGVLTIHGDNEIDNPTDVVSFDDAQLGGNIGVGLMAFQEAWGFRAGLRYFAGLNNDDASNAGAGDLLNAADLLGDTSFWQFNAGVSYRW